MTVLSVVIPNWNGEGIIERCLESLFADLSTSPSVAAEVIVVDNASSDGSIRSIAERWPNVRLFRMSTNFGFARACNVGIAASSGRFVWLLNADVVISPGCIAGMLDFVAEYPGVGLANPMVTWPDGRPQPSLATIPSFREALWEEVFWHTRLFQFTRQRQEKRGWVAGVDYRLPQPMEFLRGSCLLIRREVIDTVGVLDPAFFFGHEELDYCRRVRDAGWELLWIGERATVVHHASAASGKFGRELVLWRNDSKFLYWRKWRGRTAEGALRLVTGILAMSKWLALWARGSPADLQRSTLERRIAAASFGRPLGLPEAERSRAQVTGLQAHGSHDYLAAVIGEAPSVLDIGCGSGHLLARLHRDGVGLVAGVELEFERLKEARSFLPTGQLVCADLQRGLPLNAPGKRFRVAVIADVVEHLVNGQELLTVLGKPAEEGGSGFARLVISIPNVGYWRVRAMLLRGHWTYEDHGILDRTHIRFYSLDSAAELLQDSGWLVGAYHVVPGNKGSGVRGRIARSLSRLAPRVFGYQFVFDCYPAAPRSDPSGSPGREPSSV